MLVDVRFSSKAALAREAVKAAAIGVSAGGPRLLVLFGARAAIVPILSLSTPDYDRLKLFVAPTQMLPFLIIPI